MRSEHLNTSDRTAEQSEAQTLDDKTKGRRDSPQGPSQTQQKQRPEEPSRKKAQTLDGKEIKETIKDVKEG